MKAAFTGFSAFAAIPINMNMMTHQGFACAADTARSSTSARHLSAKSSDFAVLLAVASARQLCLRSVRNFASAQLAEQDSLQNQKVQATALYQPVIKAIANPQSDLAHAAQYYPTYFSHRFSNLVMGKTPLSSSFGKKPESPVYHGVSINVQSLGLEQGHQDAESTSSAADMRMLKV
jgi:membrane-bound lytic murein transglycosylase